LGCNVIAYNATMGGPPAALTRGAPAGTYTLAPILINAGPGNGSDSLEVNYANPNLLVAPVALYQNQVIPTDPFVVANRFGFNVGDLILAVEPNKSCTLAQPPRYPALSTTINRVVPAPVVQPRRLPRRRYHQRFSFGLRRCACARCLQCFQ
jgi:hypothetical protein